MPDRTLRVEVIATIDNEVPKQLSRVVVIPPDYDAADVNALTRRAVEDLAFDHSEGFFHRSPTRRALVALAARLRGIQYYLDGPGLDEAEKIIAIREILDLTNDDATIAWGEARDG